MEQLSIFNSNFKHVERTKVKSFTFKNYKRIHGELNVPLSPGITIITPDHDNVEMTEDRVGADFDPMEQHIDTLCQNDLLEMIQVLRNEKEYELRDYSFFASDNYVSSGIVLEDDRHFERRLRYRGTEQMGIYKGKTFSKLKKDDLYEYNKTVRNMAIYPFDFPTLGKTSVSKSMNHLLSEYPFLNKEELINDFNTLSIKYALYCGFKKNGEMLGEFGRLEEIVMLIALEKQLSHSMVIISHAFKSVHLHDEDFNKLLRLLTEFKEQQVVFMYDNPYDLTDWYQMMDFVNSYPDYYQVSWFNEVHKNDWDNVSIKIAARELIERQEMDLDGKIAKSKKIIKKAIYSFEKLAIGVSYGKDSMVMLDLVKKSVDEINEDIKKRNQTHEEQYPYANYPIIVFSDTGVEFPEHYKFIKEQEIYLKSIGFEIHHTEPETSFFRIVKDKGFPMFGKAIREKTHPEIYNKIQELGIRTCGNTCCEQLKEIPSAKLYEKLKVDLVFVGLLAVESKIRRERWYALGDIYFNKTEGNHKALPIIHFKEEDIFEYCRVYNVPLSPLYSMGYWKTNESGDDEYVTYTRTGCWPCSMNIQFSGNNMEMLRNTHPHLWELIMVKKGLGKEIYKFKHGIAEEKWTSEAMTILDGYLKVKPCHFDSA